MLTALLALPHRRHRRRSPVLFDDVVKPEFRTGTDERLQKRLYEVPSKAS